jgi:Cdc6-like AAA superfamily ATPase
MSIVLPDAPQPAGRQSPSTLLIYGPPKVGKTKVLSLLPDNLIVDLEKGSQKIEAMRVEANSVKELGALFGAIKERAKKYDYITIDTISKLEEMVLPKAMELYRSSPMSSVTFKSDNVLDLPQGAGYRWLREAFQNVLDAYHPMPAKCFIMTAHLRARYLEGKDGTEVMTRDLELTGKIRTITGAAVDAIGYVYRSSENNRELRISFQAQEGSTMGSRCQHLAGQDFVLAKSDEAGKIIEHNWNKIFID